MALTFIANAGDGAAGKICVDDYWVGRVAKEICIMPTKEIMYTDRKTLPRQSRLIYVSDQEDLHVIHSTSQPQLASSRLYR